MSTRLLLSCDGCDNEATSEPLRRHFDSMLTSSLGRFRYDRPDDVAPDGWQWRDPYTACTYCPTCWAEIDSIRDQPIADGGRDVAE